MKTNHLQKMVAVLAVTSMTLAGMTTMAQGAPAATTVPPAVVAPAPELFYGVPQILKLVQAKVSDDTIIAYIRNSGNGYGLNADQIIYLRLQGVSDAVLSAMLTQPRAGMPLPMPATPAPPVTYVPSIPDTTYYSEPYVYYTAPYYYPAYAWYPSVTYCYGWGGGWRGGWPGGWRGSAPVWGGGWRGGDGTGARPVEAGMAVGLAGMRLHLVVQGEVERQEEASAATDTADKLANRR